MANLSKFVKDVLAIIKGDDAEAIAQKIKSKGTAVITAQVSIKTATRIDLVEAKENAEANVKLALANNGNPISDGNQFIRNLFNAEQELEKATLALEKHDKEVEILERHLKVIQD